MRTLHSSLLALAMGASSAGAAQLDIVGPTGSNAFGEGILVLPNGNIVVTDPFGPVSSVGVVYLYSPAGVLISTLTGSSANDSVGSGGVVVLTNGNYVILSPNWNNGLAEGAGAVTWANANTGISGVVSTVNSLVGTSPDDGVGFVSALANGNYVVRSRDWDNGGVADAGAVTWADGTIGRSGAVSVANSLIGTTAEDSVGVVTALANGHYVVHARGWNNGSAEDAGAVTWANGGTGLVGVVSPSNSLVGTTPFDEVGDRVTALANGDYVVGIPAWDNAGVENVGAMTWINGAAGLTGVVSPANSLIGTTSGDEVGSLVTELANGHFVVQSPRWTNGTAGDAGAVTWVNGETGLVGVVSPANSLVGTSTGDSVGSRVIALANGNYVVGSRAWSDAGTPHVGAATWADGSVGISGPVSPANSLIGTSADDEIGGDGITALANGNYVISSGRWDHGVIAEVGAVTWADGGAGLVGTVTAGNSLIGTTPGDAVGNFPTTALSNGNYVVSSPDWDNGLTENVGAATWADGSTGLVGVVSSANSLVGERSGDAVAFGDAVALADGNYLVISSLWDFGGISNAGAVTWGNGDSGITGEISPLNSLVGTNNEDGVGSGGVAALEDGNYVVYSPGRDFQGVSNAGAVTLARAADGLSGFITPDNSVQGTEPEGFMPFDYDETREQLVVGRPASNLVSLFTLPQATLIFANGFD